MISFEPSITCNDTLVCERYRIIGRITPLPRHANGIGCVASMLGIPSKHATHELAQSWCQGVYDMHQYQSAMDPAL